MPDIHCDSGSHTKCKERHIQYIFCSQKNWGPCLRQLNQDFVLHDTYFSYNDVKIYSIMCFSKDPSHLIWSKAFNSAVNYANKINPMVALHSLHHLITGYPISKSERTRKPDGKH